MISEHPADIILLDYVEGQLKADESDSVRRHIATCRACKRTLAEISTTVTELERLPTAELAREHAGHAGALRGHLRTAARLAPLLIALTALLCTLLIIRPDTAGRRSSQSKAATRGAAAASGYEFRRMSAAGGLEKLQRTFAPYDGTVLRVPPGGRLAYVIVFKTRRAFARAMHATASLVGRRDAVDVAVVWGDGAARAATNGAAEQLAAGSSSS
jgi:anti-sigma factor RsiW